VRQVQERRAEHEALTEAPGGPAVARGRTLVLAAVAAVVVALDQLTKWWAVEALDDRTIDLVWTLRLNLTLNEGAAFGLGGSGLGPVIGVLAVVVVAALVRAGRVEASPVVHVALGMVAGGAVGNLLDRAFRTDPGDGFMGGAVVDFIDLQWWPIFNVADVALVCGVILLFVKAPR
jgi:signal peptidase II